MIKRLIPVVLVLIMLLGQPVGASTLDVLGDQGFGDRIEVFRGLGGLIGDKATNIQLNPAFLTQVKNKTLFTDFYLESVEKETEKKKSKLKLASNLGYRLSKDNVLGGKVAFNSEKGDYILKAADGYSINQQIAVGGRTGIEHLNGTTQVVLIGGARYQPTEEIRIDGKVGLVETDMNLFIRGQQKLSSTEQLIGVINFKEGLEKKRLALGKRIDKSNSLFVYGGNLVDNSESTEISLAWGAELGISEKLTVRAGDYYSVFSIDNSDNSTEVKLPSINKVNIGASYRFNETTTVDLACTPQLKFSNNSRLELSFTLHQIF